MIRTPFPLAVLLLAVLNAVTAPALAAPAQAEGLAAALRATMSAHPSVAGKRAEVAAKGHGVEAAQAQRYPTLSAQAATNDDSTHPVTLRARQPVWAFGRIDSSIAHADADLRAETADLVRVQRVLIEQTATAYAKVRGVMDRLAVARDNVAALGQLHEQIQRREKGQLASAADVRLALARLTQARAQVARYAGEADIALTELQALTQTPVSTRQAVPDTVTELPGPGPLMALAEEQSADMQLRREYVALAEAEAAVERTAAFPTVYLQADKYLNQAARADNGAVIGVVIEGSLEGMGFATRGRNRAAQSRVEAARQALEAARTDLGRTVRTLDSSRAVQQDLIESQRQSVSELDALLASYRRQYEAGSKSWLDVLNMQRELTDQRLQQAQAEHDWLSYTLKLAALTGRLDALAAAEN